MKKPALWLTMGVCLIVMVAYFGFSSDGPIRSFVRAIWPEKTQLNDSGSSRVSSDTPISSAQRANKGGVSADSAAEDLKSRRSVNTLEGASIVKQPTAPNPSFASAAKGIRTQPRGAMGNRAPPAGIGPPEAIREQAAQTYGPFFDANGIDPSVRAKVLDAMIGYEKVLRSSVDMMVKEGRSVTDTARMRSDAAAQYQQQLVDLLGSEGAQAFTQYGYTQLFLPVAQDFAARCSAQGVPIPDSALVPLATNFSQNLVDPNLPLPPTDSLAQRQTIAFEQASKILSPAQLEIFKQMWAEHPWRPMP